MLKTTTETGDIGIFSIKPVPPSPQRRDTLSEVGHPNPSPRPSIEDLHRRNNSKKPSSCRDTASEIISMYGSESHKSTTSTLTPTSSEDIGQRSYSMTTCGSRHLSHHRSTATLQSQTSGGPLQRPRSPFPYPTRLKRPGVRPASPALTEGGWVDYSRMVEIDRASYVSGLSYIVVYLLTMRFQRTRYGTYKPSYPSRPWRHAPLGFRTEANSSTASLPPQGPPPSRHGPLRPPSVRTLSAASMSSWHPPYRERLDSASSRTSSLTSIVNMYHRMPPTPRAGPSGLSAEIPRYYDYTEGFEGRQPQAITPVQTLAPVPTRAANCQRPLILHESYDNLAVAFEERDSAFFEPESQNPDEIEFGQPSRDTSTPHAERCRTALHRPPSRCRTGSIRSENRSVILNKSEVGRKFARGSDIDLLPSQAGRESMDTFNPSLDLESKDAPTYSYTDYRTTATTKTKVNSPERQVEVQGGGTPTIRSEQGVILKDDTQEDTLHEGTNHSGDSGLPEVATLSSDCDAIKRRSYSEPVQDSSNDSIQGALVDGQNKFGTMGCTNSHYSRTSALHNGAVTSAPSATYHGTGYGGTLAINTDALGSNNDNAGGDDSVPASTDQASVVSQRQKFQRHKRNQAVPRISTSSLPKENNERFPHIPPSCSTTSIVSPKPISPARQLKLKNSIPQLMKALPPLPGDPGYIPPPTPSMRSTSSNECDFSEVLAPFKFTQSSIPRSVRGDGVGKSRSTPNGDQNSSLQKTAPKLRLRMKMSNGSGVTISSGTRLCDTGVDQSCSTSTPNSKLEYKADEPGIRVRTRNRLKLRSSRSTTVSTPPLATVRRNADVSASSLIADITNQKPHDLFSFPAGLRSPLYSASRNSSQLAQIGRFFTGSTLNVATPNEAASRRTTPICADQQRKDPYDVRSMETRVGSGVRQSHGLKRHLSNLRCLLARPSESISMSSDTVGPQDRVGNKSDRDVNTTKFNRIGKTFTTGGGRLARRNHSRTNLGRRVRSKLLKWVKDTKTAVRVCTKRDRRT